MAGVSIEISGLEIDVAQISDMSIELTNEGGPISATVSVNCALDRMPRIGQDTLLVTYKSQTLFRGRLETLSGRVDSSTGYTMTFAGPLVVLRDHRAFRGVYVDSDLDNWSTDQGPQTSPDTFNGLSVNASGGA